MVLKVVNFSLTASKTGIFTTAAELKRYNPDKAWELGLTPDEFKEIQDELNDIHEFANDLDWAEEERK